MTYNFADTNRSFVRYLAESQWGQIPTSGSSRVLAMTSHSLSTKKNTVVSNTIRADRMVQDVIQTEMMSDGSVNYEFSAGVVDDFLQALVAGTWTRPMTFDYVTGSQLAWATSSTLTITSATDYSTVFYAGRRIKVSGFVSPVNNGFFSISSIAHSGSVTTITVSTSTSVAEVGVAKARVEDANDVIILADTAITATSGSFAHTGAFSSAIAAGQLVAGQKIHVEGLGYETGTVAFAAVCVAATTVTVNDGVNSYTFVAGTDFAVGSANTDSATNLAAAINNARVKGVGATLVMPYVYATVSSATVTIKNLNATGGTLSKTEPAAGTNLTLVNFSGGDATQHGIYTIVSVTSDAIFVTPAPTNNSNSGGLKVTIRGSMLRNPTEANIVTQSFSLEAGYGDVSKYIISDGQRVQDFSISVSAGAIVTGSVNFMGRATTIQAGDTFGSSPYVALAAQGCEIMNATTNVGNLTKNGAALSTAIKDIKIDGKSSLRNQMAVSSKFPVGIGTGRCEITGSFQAYFQDFTLFNNFLAHDTISLAFDLQDTHGVTYFWTLPAVKVTADPINSKGIDQDVMEDITFHAFRDPTTACEIQVDRFSSLTAV